MPEDILYNDVQSHLTKTNEETLKDAVEMAGNICKVNGIIPKDLNLFLQDFRGRINCTYYYFLVTDFQEIQVETFDKQNWIFVNNLLELIKNNTFYDEDVVGVLFTYLLQVDEIRYNKKKEKV